jgi:hypothetical protein
VSACGDRASQTYTVLDGSGAIWAVRPGRLPDRARAMAPAMTANTELVWREGSHGIHAEESSPVAKLRLRQFGDGAGRS